MIQILEGSREKPYNVTFIPHGRTSLYVNPIDSSVVYATNKASAKELGQAVVRDYYMNEYGYDWDKAEYMVKQYKYVIEPETGILESVDDEYGVLRYLPKSAEKYITEITMENDYDNRKGRTVYRYYVTFTDGKTISDIGIQGIKFKVKEYINNNFK